MQLQLSMNNRNKMGNEERSNVTNEKMMNTKWKWNSFPVTLQRGPVCDRFFFLVPFPAPLFVHVLQTTTSLPSQLLVFILFSFPFLSFDLISNSRVCAANPFPRLTSFSWIVSFFLFHIVIFSQSLGRLEFCDEFFYNAQAIAQCPAEKQSWR